MPETVWNGKWHPFAERFPMLNEQEIRDLAESIRENGQIHPCVMAPDGTGLDGRNRVAACRIAGVKPTWVVSEANPVGFIVAANVHHRHLTVGQRAMAMALELMDKGQRKNGRWAYGVQTDSPESVNPTTWGNNIRMAGIVLDYRSDLADSVLTGVASLDAAYRSACDKRDADKQRTEKLDQLPDDLAALVDGGVRDLDEAVREARDRAKVTEIDAIRDADGAPPPSFTESAETGMASWSDAAKLAEEWLEQRGEAIERAQDRLRKIVSAWGAIWELTTNPDSPYVADILAGLNDEDRAKVQEILDSIKNGDQK